MTKYTMTISSYIFEWHTTITNNQDFIYEYTEEQW